MSSTKPKRRVHEGGGKTLCVTVTIHATTDWEPNYYPDHDTGREALPDFKPVTHELMTKGFMEAVVDREVICVQALRSALARAGFEEFSTEGPYMVSDAVTK